MHLNLLIKIKFDKNVELQIQITVFICSNTAEKFQVHQVTENKWKTKVCPTKFTGGYCQNCKELIFLGLPLLII